jgi:hypothetical protein
MGRKQAEKRLDYSISYEQISQ